MTLHSSIGCRMQGASELGPLPIDAPGSLPRATGQPVHGTLLATHPQERRAPFSGRAALVADDSEMNRMILTTFLERLGFAVDLATDGREAVDRWRPEQDLLCLDIQMPQQDGIAALAEIRTRARDNGLRMPLALAVTANAMSHQVAEYLSSGFDACLPKPFARAELEALLHSRWQC